MRVVHKESHFIVIDDFLPDDVFNSIYDFICMRDYKHINAHGAVARVWRLRDGFPLRSVDSYFKCYQDKTSKQRWEFPVDNVMDQFADAMDRILPALEPYIGGVRQQWDRFSVTSWMYPRGTGLSLHEDSGPYSGAYTFFVNPRWNIHWGGQLMVLPEQATAVIEHYKSKQGEKAFRLKKWVDSDEEEALLAQIPVAMSVVPRPNRLVVMSKQAQHLVSTVNDNAGDTPRMSIAGFFELNKSKGN
jgi:Rps23 Pro-64 3,4-dihydroxylase Tpa1-like proline 4-hydroxylase